MTLIEVIVALLILATAMMSIASYMTKFARAVSVADVKATADELAASRLETVKTAPRYTAVDSLYAGTETLSGSYLGFTRVTAVTRTGGGPSDLYDYKTVTVTVTNRRLAQPVRKTTVIAFF